ncbi:MAG: hypothetical protein RLZZ05_1314 [Bacteroidota bacterium]
MKTTDFEGKNTKILSFSPINYHLTLKSIFTTETFFSVIVSVVLRLQIENGTKRTDHRTSERAIYQAWYTVYIDG